MSCLVCPDCSGWTIRRGCFGEPGPRWVAPLCRPGCQCDLGNLRKGEHRENPFRGRLCRVHRCMHDPEWLRATISARTSARRVRSLPRMLSRWPGGRRGVRSLLGWGGGQRDTAGTKRHRSRWIIKVALNACVLSYTPPTLLVGGSHGTVVRGHEGEQRTRFPLTPRGLAGGWLGASRPREAFGRARGARDV